MRNSFPEEATSNHPLELASPPSSWEIVSVSDIASDVTPGFASGKHNSDGTGVPHLRPMNIDRDGKIDLSVVKFVGAANDRKLSIGDVLFNNTNSPVLVGKTAAIGATEAGFAFSNHMTRIRPSKGINSEFLAQQLHFLWASGYLKYRCTNHVNQASISSKTLADAVPLLLPPWREQDRITEKLDELLSELDAGIAELKAAQAKLSQFRNSLLKAAVEGALTASWRQQRSTDPARETGAQLLERILNERRRHWEAEQLAKFEEQGKKPPKGWQAKYPEPAQPDVTHLPKLPEGWAWATIDQVASDEPYSLAIGPFGSNLKVADYRETGVPLVFVRNIRSGKYGGENTKFISPDKAKSLAQHRVDPFDVLVTKMGEPPGDADVYPDNQEPAVITADCIKIRCDKSLMRPQFLKAVINSSIGQRQIAPITKGVAQKKVSLGRFKQIAAPIPPLDEQEEVERILREAMDSADQLSADLDVSNQTHAAQRQNILRAAFSGQLVPQDPNDEPASVLLERIRVNQASRKAKPRAAKSTKKKAMKESTPVSLSEWITAYRDREFSFDDLRAAFPGDYEVLKMSVFDLLGSQPAVIEQFFDSKAGSLRFRKVEQ